MRRMNLVDFIFESAERLKRLTGPAIVCEQESISYQVLYGNVRRFAGVLRTLGVTRGERVAIVASDCPDWIVAFLGTVMIGAVAVPASTMLPPAGLKYVLDHSGAAVLLLTSEQLEKLNAVRSSLSKLRTALLIDGEQDDTLNLNQALSNTDEAEIEPVDDDTLAFILYTSGSTGEPKGAMHRHGNLRYTVETCCKEILDVKPGDRLFSSSRLFFAYGLGNSLSFPLAAAATTVLCKQRPTPAVIATVLEQHSPTIFFGVPAVYRALLEYASQGHAIKTDSLRLCISAGEKLPETIYAEWKERTGLEILDGIGSTEMLQMFISNRAGRIKPGSSGEVISGYEAKLVDEKGTEIEGAGTGRLFIKGGSASPGYWNDPEKTAATMDGEWMRTGDLYHRDADGFYWFEGRSDDLFKVKGLWVSPIEVEEALLSCPNVIEAAAVPGANRDGMNVVIAYVVRRESETSDSDAAESLKAAVAERLPPYKCPTEIRFASELPRTATGKLQRFKLREQSKTAT